MGIENMLIWISLINMIKSKIILSHNLRVQLLFAKRKKEVWDLFNFHFEILRVYTFNIHFRLVVKNKYINYNKWYCEKYFFDAVNEHVIVKDVKWQSFIVFEIQL